MHREGALPAFFANRGRCGRKREIVDTLVRVRKAVEAVDPVSQVFMGLESAEVHSH